MERDTNASAQRDASSLRIMGFFFTVLGVLVAIGTFWAWGEFRGALVNLTSGLVLAGIGMTMVLVGRRGRRRGNTS